MTTIKQKQTKPQTQINININNKNISVWTIPGYSDYAINEEAVYSNKSGSWKVLKTPLCKSTGYLQVCLTGENSTQNTHAFHKLLYCSAILGEIIQGRDYVIDHIDSNRSNNALDNLQMISFQENIQKGSKTVLDVNTVANIWKDWQTQKYTILDLVKIHNIEYKQIHKIVTGANWNSITNLPKDKTKQQQYYKTARNKKLIERLNKLSAKFDALREELEGK